MKKELIYIGWVGSLISEIHEFISETGASHSPDFVNYSVVTYFEALHIIHWFEENPLTNFNNSVTYLNLISNFEQGIDEIELGNKLGLPLPLIHELRCMQWG